MVDIKLDWFYLKVERFKKEHVLICLTLKLDDAYFFFLLSQNSKIINSYLYLDGPNSIKHYC